ncbi:MAG: AAA family ATPase [Gemmatimonadales bacterium]|nr:AAA family ATPase [Gemmatimonadales bacterium]
MNDVPFDQRILRIPASALVVTIGAAGSGKTRWVQRNFESEQILALDDFRRLVAGSTSSWDRQLGDEAFDLLLVALDARARRAVTTVVDGAFLLPERRRRVLQLAAQHGRATLAVCFRVPAELAQYRNREGNRVLPSKVLREQVRLVDAFDAEWRHEGWTRVVFFAHEDTDLLPVVRYELPAALPHPGPYDVIGDVHGCRAELDALLDRLGWAPPTDDGTRHHPDGRLAVFVGDFADRGPDTPGVFRRVMAMHAAGTALAVPGNHCLKLLRHLRGKHVEISHGLDATLAQLDAEPDRDALAARIRAFLEGLPRVLVLGGGQLVVFHAALARDAVGRTDEATYAQTAFGVVRGTDENGFPVRDTSWTEGWREGEGEPLAVYGHTPVREPLRMHHTLNIDGGCVFGGYLCALRFPERRLVMEPAHAVHYASPKVSWRGVPTGA